MAPRAAPLAVRISLNDMPGTPCLRRASTAASSIRSRVLCVTGSPAPLTRTVILLDSEVTRMYVLANRGVYMPFTVTAPHGVLTASGRQQVIPLLTKAAL